MWNIIKFKYLKFWLHLKFEMYSPYFLLFSLSMLENRRNDPTSTPIGLDIISLFVYVCDVNIL
jgi:hypothetical protein